MSDLIADGVSWLDSQRKEYLGTSVSYYRGGTEIELTATIGQTRYEQSDEEGVSVRGKVVDVLISASDLVIDDERITPELGDKITFTRDGRLQTYEVLDFAGTGHVSASDPFGDVWRVHTKLISVVP